MAKLKAEAEEIVRITPDQIKLIETTIETTLAKNNVNEQQIAKWEEEFKALKINGVDDKDGYAKVYESRQKAKQTRILIKGVCEAGRAPLIAETKEWIRRQNAYIARIESIEDHLQAEEDKINAEKEKIKADKIRIQTERLKGRVAIISGFGAMFDGSHYVLDDISYSHDILRETEDDYFTNKIVPQYRQIFEAKEAIAKANKEAQDVLEAQQRQIAEDLKRQTEELQRQQDELKRQQDELDKQKRDAQAASDLENERITRERQLAHSAKVEKRSQQLVNMGLTYDWSKKIFFLREVTVAITEVENEPDEKWLELVELHKGNIELVRAAIKAEADAEQERLNKIAIDNANAERERQSEEKRKQEREDLEFGDDTTRWSFFIKAINGITIPVMKSRQYKKMIEESTQMINTIKQMKVPK